MGATLRRHSLSNSGTQYQDEYTNGLPSSENKNRSSKREIKMSCRAGLNKIIPQEGSRGKCSQDREMGSWERTPLTSTPNPEISSVIMIQGWWEWLWGKDPQIPPPPVPGLLFVLCALSVECVLFPLVWPAQAGNECAPSGIHFPIYQGHCLH